MKLLRPILVTLILVTAAVTPCLAGERLDVPFQGRQEIEFVRLAELLRPWQQWRGGFHCFVLLDREQFLGTFIP
jgi:hypothetical protein